MRTRVLAEDMVELDGEHYNIWIEEKLRAGRSDERIIAELRAFTRNRYSQERYQEHVNIVKRYTGLGRKQNSAAGPDA